MSRLDRLESEGAFLARCLLLSMSGHLTSPELRRLREMAERTSRLDVPDPPKED